MGKQSVEKVEKKDYIVNLVNTGSMDRSETKKNKSGVYQMALPNEIFQITSEDGSPIDIDGHDNLSCFSSHNGAEQFIEFVTDEGLAVGPYIIERHILQAKKQLRDTKKTAGYGFYESKNGMDFARTGTGNKPSKRGNDDYSKTASRLFKKTATHKEVAPPVYRSRSQYVSIKKLEGV